MNAGSPDQEKGRPALSEAALFGLCPQCGARTLFAGWIKLASRCRACGLDYDQFNVGDGPAAFLILLIGALVTGLAVWFEVSADPPWWLHVILWLPLTVGLTLGGLRLAKAALLASEYQNRAREAGTKDL
jgi:uncharacterized protein (DUF983 family)